MIMKEKKKEKNCSGLRSTTGLPYLVWLATRSYLMANMSVKTMAASAMRCRSWLQASASFSLKALAALLYLLRQPLPSRSLSSSLGMDSFCGRQPSAPVPWIQNFLPPCAYRVYTHITYKCLFNLWFTMNYNLFAQ